MSMKSPPVAFWMAWPTRPGFACACATPVEPYAPPPQRVSTGTGSILGWSRMVGTL